MTLFFKACPRCNGTVEYRQWDGPEMRCLVCGQVWGPPPQVKVKPPTESYSAIRQARAKVGLSQRDIAHLINRNSADVSRYESGKAKIPAAVAVALCDLLGLTPYDLWPQVKPEAIEAHRAILRDAGTVSAAELAERHGRSKRAVWRALQNQRETVGEMVS